jgi:hypothetical protein
VHVRNDPGWDRIGECRECFDIQLLLDSPQAEVVHLPIWVDGYRTRGMDSSRLLSELVAAGAMLQAATAAPRYAVGYGVYALAGEAVRVQQTILDPWFEWGTRCVNH